MSAILLVDGENSFRQNLRALFEDLGYGVSEAANGREGLQVFAQEQPDLVLADIRMPEMDGLTFIGQLRQISPETPVVVVSGLMTAQDAIEAVRRGAWDYLVKPITDPSELELTVRRAMEHAAVLAENRRYREHLEELVAERTRQLCESEESLREFAEALEDKTEALRDQAEALTAANRVKDEFLNKVTHELRTPLNAIMGFSRGLLDYADRHPLDDHQKDRISKIQSSGEHLLSLVNNVLEMCTIEAGKARVEASTFAIGQLAEEIGQYAANLLARKGGVRFALDLPDDLPPLSSDRDKLQKVLQSLVSNAAKFTQEGTVTLRITPRGRSLVIEVEDSGIGIPSEHLERVFDKFHQAPSPIHLSLAGTGLGLAICRSYVTLLGGSIGVRSVEGQGSAFTVTLPLVLGEVQPPPPTAGAEPPPAPRATSEQHPKILCVDADWTGMMLLADYLLDAGYHVLPAFNAQEALRMAIAGNPRVIVLEAALPEFAGWEVLRWLHADSSTSHIPVIMTAASEEKQKALELGAHGYLRKPFGRSELLDSLRTALTAHAASQSSPVTP